MMRQLIACCLLIGIVLAALPAAAAKRVALVIGNSAYQNATPLPNPVNDGRAVADALRRLDFVVIEATDQDKTGMQKLLRQFSAELQGADASLFFYAGHGLQVQGQNYLVPVDAALESEVDLPFEALAVDVVLDLMEQTTALRLVFLDACRDNPLARRLSRAVGPSRSLAVGRGLARMSNRVGTLIAFATEPDKVALDGEGEHSPFTQALLEHIETPGIEVRQMLSRVRATVIDQTGGEQLPLDTSALVDDFYFAAPAPAEPAPTVPAAAPGVASTEQLFWQSIQASTDPNDFRAYLESYPDGPFAPLARNRLNGLSAPPRTEVAALTPPTEAPPAATPPESPAAEIVEVAPLDTTVVATRNVNMRGAPNTDGDPLGVVGQGSEVAVVGKVIGADWYQIERPDGGEAYVYAPLFLSPDAFAAATEPAATPAQAQAPTPAAPAPAAAEPVQMAGVAPNVAAAPGTAPVTRAGPVPSPHVNPAALLQTLGERARNVNFRFTYQVKGDRGSEFVAFSRWQDVGSSDDAPSLAAGDAAGTRVQAASETFGEAVMATQVTPELFGVLMYSRAIHSGRATFMPIPVAGSLTQWTFLTRHGARIEATSSLVVEGVQFEVAALSLNDGAPASSCLGFIAYQVSRRLDGFVCRPAGPAFDVAQANAVLSQIRVPRFIEP